MLPVKISRLVSCAREAGQTNSTPHSRAGVGRAHPTLLRARHDPLALRIGVGDAAHGRLGVVLREPQRDGAPAAAHVQQPEAALELVELRPLGVEPQHAVLRLVQQRRRLRGRRAGGGVERGGVLGVLAQHDLVEARRHLVVLLVRVVGVDGDGRGLELLHKGQQPRLLRGVVGLPLLLQPALQQLPDPDARQEVGQLVALERVEEQRREGIREGGARRGDGQRHRAALQRRGGERREHGQLLERHLECLGFRRKLQSSAPPLVQRSSALRRCYGPADPAHGAGQQLTLEMSEAVAAVFVASSSAALLSPTVARRPTSRRWANQAWCAPRALPHNTTDLRTATA